jgi:hypothetical protein
MGSRGVGDIRVTRRENRVACENLVHKIDPDRELELDANEARVLAAILMKEADKLDPPAHSADFVTIRVHRQMGKIHHRLLED